MALSDHSAKSPTTNFFITNTTTCKVLVKTERLQAPQASQILIFE
jgi:hypothetical protein